MDWADDVLFLTDTQEQLETLGERACAGAQECGTGINNKTECRVFGPVRHCPDAIQIGPFSCGSLRSVCKYLGILIPPSLTGGPHQDARTEKGYKAVGQLNAIWANHKGIGLGEEIQLWMTYGWSTLGFGCELWPWGGLSLGRKGRVGHAQDTIRGQQQG